MKFTNIKKRIAVVVAAVAIAGAAGASAASLGGVGGDDLGADTGAVGACDTDGIDVDWTPVFDASSARYVARFTLRDIDTECLATPYRIAIFQTGASGVRAQGSFDRFRGITRYIRASDGEQVFRTSYTSRFPVELVEGIAIEIGGQRV